MSTRAAVEDNQRLLGPDLDARGVAAESNRRRSRFRNGATGAPELDPHRHLGIHKDVGALVQSHRAVATPHGAGLYRVWPGRTVGFTGVSEKIREVSPDYHSKFKGGGKDPNENAAHGSVCCCG